MKKLMTMLAAAAMAFGLYADDGLISGAAFDSTDAGEKYSWNATDKFVTGFWSVIPETTSVISGDSELDSANRPEEFKVGHQHDGVLSVKTTLTNPIQLNAQAGGDSVLIPATGLYFDGLVKMTVFDEVPGEYSDAKIAVYLLQTNEEDSVKFIVRAKNDGTMKDWECLGGASGIAGDEWHRLTIKTIADIGTGSAGFVIFVDGIAVNCTAAKLPTDGLNLVALNYSERGELFLPLAATTAIAGVAFDGQGSVDELVFTKTAPTFAADPQVAELVFDTAKGANFMYSLDGVAWDDATSPLKFGDGADIAFPAGGKVWLKWDGSETYCGKKKQYDIISGTTTTVPDSDYTQAEASFNGVGYSLADAIKAANDAETAGTLKLLEEAKTAILINNTKGAVITIDLNGNTASGSPMAIQGLTAVVIDDKSDAQGTVSSIVAGNLTIKKGIFDNTVNIAGSTIEGGWFKNDPSTRLATGYIAPKDATDNYYKVKQGAWAFEVSGAKFETLAEAFAAVPADGTITVIGDTLIAGVRATNTQNNVTLDLNGKTLTHASDNEDYTMIVCGSLVITNGTIVKNNKTTMIKVGLKENEVDISGELTIADATIDDQTATSGCALNIENGSATLKSGAIKTAGHTDNKYETVRVKAGCSFTMEDGEIVSDKYAITIKSDATAVSIQGGEITGAIDNEAELTEFISGGKFSVEPTAAWIADGMKAKLNSGWYEIVAIQYATLKLDIDTTKVTSYTITDGLTDGSTVDIDDAKIVKASGLVFVDGYELDNDKSELSVGPMTEVKDYTIKVVAKATQTGPQPSGDGAGGVVPVPDEPGVYVVTGDSSSHNVSIDPSTLLSTDTIRVTDSTIGKITGVPADQIEIKLNGVTEPIDQKYFVGGNATDGFSLELSDEAKAVLVEETEDDKPLVIGEDVDVTIQSVAGLKYQLVRGTEVGAITTKLGEPVVGDGEPLTLTDEHKPADKAFYVIETSK